jgi:hypothetical protein
MERKENQTLTGTLGAQALRDFDTLGKWFGLGSRLYFDMRACGIMLGR